MDHPKNKEALYQSFAPECVFPTEVVRKANLANHQTWQTIKMHLLERKRDSATTHK